MTYTITRHQRVFGYVWHWATGPGWWRDPDPNTLAPLNAAGMYGLRVQLQDDGAFPRELADTWRAAGFRVDGMVGHVGAWSNNPEGLARWLRVERVRLALAGIDCNFEDEVLAFDQASGGRWSERFANELRRLCPTLPLYLDSYWGPMGGGINLGAYKARGFRFNVQTFWGDGVWDDPPSNIVAKGAGADPVIPKAIIKPIFRVGRNNQGQYVAVEKAIADTQAAGTKGCCFYPIDAEGDWHTLNLLPRAAIRAGIAY